jgi:uncharacterized membrane protein YciS (DUF1049 family)
LLVQVPYNIEQKLGRARLEFLDKMQKLWLIGATLALVSVAAPWWGVSGSASAGGSPYLILILIGGLLAFAGRTRPRARAYATFLILLGTILTFADAIASMSRISSYGGCGSGTCYTWELSWGFYFAVIASLTMIVSFRSSRYRAVRSFGARPTAFRRYASLLRGKNLGLRATAFANLIVGLVSLYMFAAYGLMGADSGYLLLFGVLSMLVAWALWKCKYWSPLVTLLIIGLLLVYLGLNGRFANVLETVPVIILFEGLCYVYARARIVTPARIQRQPRIHLKHIRSWRLPRIPALRFSRGFRLCFWFSVFVGLVTAALVATLPLSSAGLVIQTFAMGFVFAWLILSFLFLMAKWKTRRSPARSARTQTISRIANTYTCAKCGRLLYLGTACPDCTPVAPRYS